jgi:hypothetical protein
LRVEIHSADSLGDDNHIVKIDLGGLLLGLAGRQTVVVNLEFEHRYSQGGHPAKLDAIPSNDQFSIDPELFQSICLYGIN